MDFDVSLACECAPWNMSYQNITGYLDMNVKKGVFTDQDPHIGRILSLLNIQSIAKRLSLNFSDVTNKGFTYESIATQVRLKNAIAKIEDFNLEALSSNIVLTGQSHINDKQYDLMAKVTPAISDAVPIATYLAGGGLIGLGVWAIDKTLFGGKLINKAVDKVAAFEYKITGAWDKPIIKEQ
ncbi:FIG006388: Possible exported protein [uncultured Gammaproteobacteria bacterium]|nr:FIG006388: Possible exported protein [uncultured Gammaproteobacteria bacterium]